MPAAIPLLTTRESRTLEARHAALPLMERAGLAAAGLAQALLGAARAPVLVLAGPGNNGGDAFVVARHLHLAGRAVVVAQLGDADRLPADAARARQQLTDAGVRVHRDAPAGKFALVVDGLFGIGLTRPLEGVAADCVARINAFAAAGGPVLALDIPSGLDGDSGQVLGVAVQATHTATFIAAKPGLYTADGPDHAGEVTVFDLGLPVMASLGATLARSEFAAQCLPRRANSHKGSFGSLAVLGGAAGMTGAALLAARAGLHLGAGRVFVGLLAPLAVDPAQPELMLRSANDALAQATAVVAGPGLGDAPAALDAMRRLATTVVSSVLDADALNLLAAHPVLASAFARRSAPTILTPHPAEAARLLATDTATVQRDRIGSARALAVRFAAPVVLKGCGSVVAHPDGRWRINTSGNPALATGGTGDVLAGLLGALLAQGWPAWEAALAGTHLHGLAADDAVAAGHGLVGLAAGELIPFARARFNAWLAPRA